METENLWGEIPNIKGIRTPVEILREQGNLLSKLTKGVLEAEVSSRQEGRRLIAEMDIIVPGLNMYRLTIVRIDSELNIYPMSVSNVLTGGGGIFDYLETIECKNEGEYTKALKTVLSSNEVKNTIKALLAQLT